MRVVVGAVVTAAGWAAVVAAMHGGSPVPGVVLVGLLWGLTAGLTWWVTRGPVPRRVRSCSSGWPRWSSSCRGSPSLPSPAPTPIATCGTAGSSWPGSRPYRYAPLDDRLASLRDPVLFPGLGPGDPSGYLTEPVPTDRAELFRRAADDPRTPINRPRVPTIYPPVAEAWFTAVAAVTPWSAGTLGLQVGSALLAAAVAVALAALARRAGRTPAARSGGPGAPSCCSRRATAPTSTSSRPPSSWGRSRSRHAQGRAHAPGGRRPGLAVGRGRRSRRPRRGRQAHAPRRPPHRRPVASPGSPSVGRAAVCSRRAGGGLPPLCPRGGPARARLPARLPPRGGQPAGPRRHPPPGPPGAGRLPGGGARRRRRGRGDHPLHARRRRLDPARGAAVLLGVFLLAGTPVYGWYALPLVALAVLAGRLKWLAVSAAAALAYATAAVPPVPAVAYAVSGVVVALTWWLRRRRLPAGSLGDADDDRAGEPVVETAPAVVPQQPPDVEQEADAGDDRDEREGPGAPGRRG